MRNAIKPKSDTATGDTKLAATATVEREDLLKAPPDHPLAGLLDKTGLLKLVPWSSGTLSNRMKSGDIPYIKIGARVMFDWPSVKQSLLRRQRGGGQ